MWCRGWMRRNTHSIPGVRSETEHVETTGVTTDTATHFEHSRQFHVLERGVGDVVDIGSTHVRFLARSAETGGGFSLIEYPIPARTLVAPLHRHSREDEYRFVLEGRMATVPRDQVLYAAAGDLTFKPRGQWHTVWNSGEEPSRILEIISPGGFEHFFAEFAASLKAVTDAPCSTRRSRLWLRSRERLRERGTRLRRARP